MSWKTGKYNKSYHPPDLSDTQYFYSPIALKGIKLFPVN